MLSGGLASPKVLFSEFVVQDVDGLGEVVDVMDGLVQKLLLA